MRKWPWIVGGLLVCSLTHAAIPPKKTFSSSTPSAPSEKAKSDEVSLEATQSALSLPLVNRVQVIRAQGPSGYRNLLQTMFDTKKPMNLRWRAVTSLGRIGGEMSQPDLLKAAEDREWFMRSAALVAMAEANREAGLTLAKKLLEDKALLVRLAAVDVIASAGNPTQASSLWQALNQPENFRGKQSLFIRRRIVEALGRLEKPGSESKFASLLSDKDESLHSPAIQALEHLTKKKLGKRQDDLKTKRLLWQNWAKAKI